MNMGGNKKKHHDPAQELELAAELFGGAAGGSAANAEDLDTGLNEGHTLDIETPELDGPAEAEARQGDASVSGRGGAGKGAGKRKPAWVDDDVAELKANVVRKKTLRKLRKEEDEEEITGNEFENRLRQHHAKMHRAPQWAKAKKRDAADEIADGLLRKAGKLTAGMMEQARLPPNQLDTTRMRDANQHEPSKSVVTSVEFHPSGQVMLASGLDKHLRLFQVDGLRNPKLQTVFFEDCPVTKAAFCLGGSSVLCAGRRPHFYMYNVDAGRIDRIQGMLGRSERSWESFAVSEGPESMHAGDPLAAFVGDGGSIPLFSLKSRCRVGELTMPGSARNVAWAKGGTELISSGTDGVVHVWDVRMRRCVVRFVDDGCVRSTALAATPGGEMYAAGSDMGVVNLYKAEAVLEEAGAGMGAASPAPVRALMQLTTTVDTLRFSPDGQMLAMASRMEKDALRIVHVESSTVFANWPTSKSPLGHVHCAAFSPGCGFFAVGNAKGRVLLYRLHHYTSV